jgi:phage terminase small subunit
VEKAKLTPKQRLFCEYYIELRCNGTQAYKKVFNPKSEATAMSNAYRLLKNKHVSAYVKKLQKEVIKKVEISREQIISEYVKLAFSNITDFIEFDDQKVKVKPSKELSPGKLSAISEVVKVAGKNGNYVKLKLHDKKAALDSLSKIFGYFAPDKLNLGIDFNQLPDEQLDLIINKLINKAENGQGQ